MGIASLFCPFQLGSLRKETESGHPITRGLRDPHPHSLLAQADLLLGLLCQSPVKLGLPWPLVTTMRSVPFTLSSWIVFSVCYKCSMSQTLPMSQDPVLILAEYP